MRPVEPKATASQRTADGGPGFKAFRSPWLSPARMASLESALVEIKVAQALLILLSNDKILDP